MEEGVGELLDFVRGERSRRRWGPGDELISGASRQERRGWQTSLLWFFFSFLVY